jgi:hypothetical protein
MADTTLPGSGYTTEPPATPPPADKPAPPPAPEPKDPHQAYKEFLRDNSYAGPKD